jgi:hypothetical protein
MELSRLNHGEILIVKQFFYGFLLIVPLRDHRILIKSGETKHDDKKNSNIKKI